MLYPWVVSGNGYQAPIGFVTVDLQRAHCTITSAFDEYIDLDAEAIGANPNFFQMNSLRKRYIGR